MDQDPYDPNGQSKRHQSTRREALAAISALLAAAVAPFARQEVAGKPKRRKHDRTKTRNDNVTADGCYTGTTCSCVTYLKARCLIPSTVVAAKDAGPKLTAAKFKAQGVPSAGAIMVFQPNALQANPTYGHIARVVDARYIGTKKWSITVEHANWSGGTKIAGTGPCSSAWKRTFTVTSKVLGPAFSYPGIAFYKK